MNVTTKMTSGRTGRKQKSNTFGKLFKKGRGTLTLLVLFSVFALCQAASNNNQGETPAVNNRPRRSRARPKKNDNILKIVTNEHGGGKKFARRTNQQLEQGGMSPTSRNHIIKELRSKGGRRAPPPRKQRVKSRTKRGRDSAVGGTKTKPTAIKVDTQRDSKKQKYLSESPVSSPRRAIPNPRWKHGVNNSKAEFNGIMDHFERVHHNGVFQSGVLGAIDKKRRATNPNEHLEQAHQKRRPTRDQGLRAPKSMTHLKPGTIKKRKQHRSDPKGDKRSQNTRRRLSETYGAGLQHALDAFMRRHQ